MKQITSAWLMVAVAASALADWQFALKCYPLASVWFLWTWGKLGGTK